MVTSQQNLRTTNCCVASRTFVFRAPMQVSHSEDEEAPPIAKRLITPVVRLGPTRNKINARADVLRGLMLRA